MRKILFIMLALTVMAMPAMASVQNVKISGDIESTYLMRNNFALGGGTGSFRQSVAIMQTRLRVDADLTDKVSATIALINEREWNADSTNTGIDLNLAYVTMKEMLYSPLTVTLGRQEFAYGNSFVIDSAGTNNVAPVDSGLNNIAEDLTKQTAQDAVRLTFDYDPLTIDLLYSAIDQGTVSGVMVADSTYLYGINAGYQFNDEKGSLVEGYVWVKEDKSGGKSTVYMPGLRGSMNVLDGWNLQVEAALQLGDIESGANKTDREAYAAQVLSNYILPFEKTDKYQPVLGLSYSYYSGDNDVASGSGDFGGEYTAWDPMYENQAGGKIVNTLFNATNIHVVGASLSFAPMEDVAANVYYDYLFMDKKLSNVGSAFALVNPTGTTPTPPAQDAGQRELGSEVGVVLTYDYTEDVQFGARGGWFFPGDHYGEATTASQLLLNAKVAF